MIARTLHALRYNDEPAEHTGTATLCRFSTPGFRLAGMEHIEEPPTPQVAVLYVLCFKHDTMPVPGGACTILNTWPRRSPPYCALR